MRNMVQKSFLSEGDWFSSVKTQLVPFSLIIWIDLDWIWNEFFLCSLGRRTIFFPLRTWDLLILLSQSMCNPWHLTSAFCTALHRIKKGNKEYPAPPSLAALTQRTRLDLILWFYDLLLLWVFKSGLVSKHHLWFHCKNHLEKPTLAWQRETCPLA